MKRKVLRLTIGMVIAAAFLLPSCEFLEDCGTCELVTEDADGNITYGTPLIFCGDQYTDKLNSVPTTIGGVTTYWNCY